MSGLAILRASVRSLLFSLAFLSAALVGNLIAPSASHAQTVSWSAPTGTLGWCTVVGPGASECFGDPQSACVKQFTVYGWPGNSPGYKPYVSWNTRLCTWNMRLGASAPTAIYWQCASGWTAEAPGRCVQQNFRLLHCSANSGGTPNPSTPFPIDVLTGSKHFDREDFATADRSIVLARTFETLPGGGFPNWQRQAPVSPFATWNLTTSLNLDLTPMINGYGHVILYAPDQSALPFAKAGDGSMYYDNNFYYISNTDYQISLVGSWPSSPWNIGASTSQWQVKGADGRIWTVQTVLNPFTGKYDTGLPTQVVDKDGRVLTFAYGSQNQLTSITDANGKQVTFDWAPRYFTDPSSGSTPAAISVAHLPGGYSIHYTYEGVSTGGQYERLIKVEWLDSSSVVQEAEQYRYNDARFPYQITSVLDGAGTTRWTIAYDSQGRATQSQGPNGEFSYTVAYGTPGQNFTRTVTDALGHSGVYNYSSTYSYSYDPVLKQVDGQATAHCPAASSSMSYSGYFVTSGTDEEGRVTHYTRDGRGRPTQIVEAYGTSAQRTTNITWNSSFNVPAQIVRPGRTIDFVYDTQGRLTSKTETDTTSYTTPYSTNGRTRTWTYGWSTTGQLQSVDGPLSGSGDTLSFGYDTSGYLHTVTNEVGQTTTIAAVNWRGQPGTMVDANGISTTFTYDVRGRLLTATINPGANQSQYQFAYDNVGNLTQITLPAGGYLQYGYDVANRLISVTNHRGEQIIYAVNAMGQATGTTVKTSGSVITAQQTAAYDELGRIIQSIGAGSQTTAMAYDKVSNRTQVTDARGKVFGTTFDPLNRVITRTDPESHTVQLAYNGQNKLTSHTDGRSLQTTRVVDGFGRTIQETSPDRGTISYWYDLADHLTKVVDGDGQETDYAYDNAGRLLSATFPGAAAETITYGYDDTTSGNKGVGRLTSVTEESGSSAFTYDAQGRLTQDIKTLQGHSYTVGYGYDANGQVTQITLPSGRAVSFTRATDGLVTAISTTPAGGSAQTLASGVTYEPYGPLAGLTYGNGLVLSRSYDQNYWLSRIQVTNGTTASLDLSYGRDADGNLTTTTDNASSGRGATFGYTDAGRLNAATGPWGADAYAYDAAGNRTDKARTIGGVTSHETPVLASASNQVQRVNDGAGAALRTLTYRTGGDISQAAYTGGPTYTYQYDARKRLAVVKNNGTDAGWYGYDFEGHRVWRSVFGSTTVQTHYIFDHQGHLLAEHDGSTGSVVREYVWLDDMPVAMIDSSPGTPQLYYIHAGQIDEPQVMTDSTGSTVWNAYVEPFGQAQVFGTPSAGLDLRLPGQWSQAETGGLHQNWFRDYDPSLGRYIEADPLGIDAGQNVYAYVDGRPELKADASGLRPLLGTEAQALSPFIPGDDLTRARIYTVPGWMLTEGVNAATLYRNIYVRSDIAQCGVNWLVLLGHELVHVGQYRNGLNPITYLSESARAANLNLGMSGIEDLNAIRGRGYDQNKYEMEAFARQAAIARALSGRNVKCGCR